MKIGIIGLGLIGGSLLKAIKENTAYSCYGYNRTASVLKDAAPYLDGALTPERLPSMDIVFVCLTPRAAVDYVLGHADGFKPGAVVADICGVKKYVVDRLEGPLKERGVHFVGCHPMAGKEVGGFKNSSAELFKGASFIITPTAASDPNAVELLSKLALELGFEAAAYASPEEHDGIIAYTSQLAHVVSSAFIKSPRLNRHTGFSAGSFQDLTRVARLDANMWTELFMLNRECLLVELDRLVGDLNKYRAALGGSDAPALRALLEEGNELKLKTLTRV